MQVILDKERLGLARQAHTGAATSARLAVTAAEARGEMKRKSTVEKIAEGNGQLECVEIATGSRDCYRLIFGACREKKFIFHAAIIARLWRFLNGHGAIPDRRGRGLSGVAPLFGIEFELRCGKRFRVMPKLVITPLPDLSIDRLLDRIAEAVRVGREPALLRKFPSWTQRVMQILQAQFVPKEYATILMSDGSALTEGIAVAWAAKARDLVQTHQVNGREVARKLAQRAGLDPHEQAVAEQVGAGALQLTDEFQRHIINRLFGPNVDERRAFVEGMAIGNRLPDLLDRQALGSTTDATGLYLVLWLYWPEIAKLKSIGEVARALEPFFSANKNLAGAHWEERVRKLANRIGLSFRAKQQRLKRKAAL